MEIWKDQILHLYILDDSECHFAISWTCKSTVFETSLFENVLIVVNRVANNFHDFRHGF